MRNTLLAIILIASTCFQFTAFGQPFTLLKDINYGNPGQCLGKPGYPMNLTELNGLLYFSIYNAGANYGLWKTDGTDAGTIRLKDIGRIETIVKVNSLLFFYVGEYGPADLWRSDGTEEGTVLLKTLNNIKNLTNVNGTLFFSDDAGLWKSDGTAAGTVLVKPYSGFLYNVIAAGGMLFFTSSPIGGALWKSDGTNAGTLAIKDGFYGFAEFTDANGVLFFGADDAINGNVLWKSDGTEAGTIMIKDLDEGTNGGSINDFVTANGVTYFFASSGPSHTSGLWRTDGTQPGTVMIKEIQGSNLTNINGVIYFSGTERLDYDDLELWKSDGTTLGTTRVKDIFPGPSSSGPGRLTNVNGKLFFNATNDDPSSGTQIICSSGWGEIWKSDGTEGGTVMVKDIYKGSGSSSPTGLVNVNGILFFVANNGTDGPQLWKTDGNLASTVMVKNFIYPTGNGNPKYFTASNGQVFFSAFDAWSSPGGSRGQELFKTDGTLSGTYQVGEIAGLGSGFPNQLTDLNGILIFSANNGSHGFELWKADAATRPVMVKDINSYLGGTGDRSSNPSYFTLFNQSLFFSANDGVNGYELWKTDGTEAGTTLVKDINPGGDSKPSNLVNLNGILYFTADNGTNGAELWKSDGTEQGTVMVKNINPNSNSNPSFLTNINGVLYFAADDGVNGVELWKSNGTESGTVLVKNIFASGNGSNPSFLTNVNGTLYFAADDGVNGIEVWKSNGTEAGTVLVKDIYNGPGSSNPNLFVNLNGVVLFAADDGISGRELWGSVGTSAGTILVKDIQPGSAGSNPTVLTRVAGCVLFAATDGIHGNEVWLSTGIENGTRMMSEIEPGAGSSDPTEFFEYGSKVLAAATNSRVGSEVWIAETPADIPNLVASVTANGPIAFCTGKNVTLNANRGVGYIYQWKKSGVNISGATQSSYTATTAGYYSVDVKDAFGFAATSETVIVTVSNPPLATVAASGPLSFCAGKNVLLKAITATGYTYQWKKAGINIANATSSNYTATEGGAYSVVVTNATGCSSTSSLLNVTINPVPLANVAAASALTFCEGKTVQLKAISGTGYTYQWKRGAADIAGATTSNYNASTTGIYTVIVTNAAGCSATSAGLNVVVKPLPAATITAGGPTTFCSGKNVLLKANTGTNYTYQWIRGATAITGANQVNFAATEPGLYTVIVTNSSGCSVTSAAIPVSVNPLPIATITPNGPLTFCAGQNVVLRANTGTNYTYQWKKAGVSIADGTQVNYTAGTSGLYSVVVTNGSGCAVTSSTVNVTVNNAPLASVAASGPTTFCAGKNVLLKAISGTGYTYQWRKNGVNISQEVTSNYTASSTGAYSVVVTNATGCSTTSSIINVAVTMAPLATVAVAGPTTFCEGSSVLLKAITGTGYVYQWRKNGANIAAQTQANYTATTAGVYSVLVTNTEGCSTLSGDINVTVTPKPASTILATGPLTFAQGGSVTLYVGTADGNIYQWKKDGVNITGATSESYTATVSGNYTVAITNAGGCQVVSLPAVVTVTQSRPITKAWQEEENITVYPNPLYRNNYLNVDWRIAGNNAVSVTVYDMSGKKISSQRLLAGDRTIKINGASGVYLVECRWGINKRKVFRVVKIE